MGVLKSRTACGLLLALLAGWPATVRAGSVAPAAHTEDEIKSAMLYNFAKFVDWPTGALGANGAPVTIGVVGDDSMLDELQATLRNKIIYEHPVVVRRIDLKADPRNCLILYVGVSDRKEVTRILQAAAHLPVLTIGDYPQFSRQGGVIAFIREGGRIRFEINLDAAERAGLQISSRLLQLANIWREGARAGN